MMKDKITKALFVYPETPVSFWSFKHAISFVGKKAAFPPLGLMTLAALMPKNYEIKLVDMNIEALKEKDILDSDIVFISAMIIQKESFQKVVTLCNSLGKKVVVGGPYPTSSHSQIEGVDYFVLGEAENTLSEFITDYENGTARHLYLSETKPDITQTPPPRFDIVDMDKYATMMLQYSRGCPFNCEFCDIIELFGRVPRTKNPDQFINEMTILYDTGFRGGVFIVDDNFIGNKARVKKLLPEIIRFQEERGYPFELSTEASLNLAEDDELLSLMARAGFNMAFVGIETPVEASLLAINKQQNTKTDLLSSIHKIQKMGIEVTGGFILGFDDDPEDIFDRQIAFIQKSGIPMSMVGLLTALPNTQLYRRLVKENRILNESTGNNTHDLQLNFIPKMDIDTLTEGYKRVVKAIYTPKNYYARCNTLLKNMNEYPSRPVAKMTLPVLAKNLKGLFASFFIQLFSGYGFEYLKFFLKNLFTRPGVFVQAVSKSVMGHHLFRITNEITAPGWLGKYIDHKLETVNVNLFRLETKKTPDSIFRIINLHIHAVTKMQKKLLKVNKSSTGHLGHTMQTVSADIKSYFTKFEHLVREKIGTIKLDDLKTNLEKIKPAILKKIAQIRKDCDVKYAYIKEYFTEAYYKAEDEINRLVALLGNPQAVAVTFN